MAIKHIPMEIEETLKGLDYKEIEKVADALKVMAHPVRIAILALLEDGKTKTVTEIFQALNMDQPPVSHHLILMKNKNILTCERDGKNNHYGLNVDYLKQILCCFKKCTGQNTALNL